MPLVKYTANADPSEGTDSIKLESTEDGQERVLVLGGDPLEISDEEASSLGGRYLLKEANEDGTLKEEPKSDTQSPQAQEQPAKLEDQRRGTDQPPNVQNPPGQSVSSQIVNPSRPGQGS